MRFEIGKILASEYQNRRAVNASKSQASIDRVYASHPELQEIDRQLISANAKIVMDIMQDGIYRESSPEKKELEQKRTQYMKDHQIPEAFDATIYTCTICHDTGFIGNNKNQPCQCYQQLLIPLLLQNSNFKNISRYTFDQFDLSLFSETPDPKRYQSQDSPRNQMEGIRSVCLHFLEQFQEPNTKSLFFLGKPGTGKTFLSGCIANNLLNAGKSVLYLSAPELFEKITEFRMLSNSYSPDPERFERATHIYQSILTCDLFILDDLGTETVHANRQPELLNLLNHRIDSGRKMIISTNLDTNTLATLYDERVLSRIYGNFSVLRFFGDDLRHIKRTR